MQMRSAAQFVLTPRIVASSSDTKDDERESDTIPFVTKYDEDGKADYRMNSRRLQAELLDAGHTDHQARVRARDAANAYASASDDEKADALLSGEAETRRVAPPWNTTEKPIRPSKRQNEFYIRRILAE